MSRRRSAPWIHRWSRPLIGGIAILGTLVTGYLTVVKLTGGTAGCVAGGAETGAASCSAVLSSPYATVFGLPLALFGCLAYVSMAAFSLVPLAVNPEQQKGLRSQLEDWTWLLLFAGATAMTVFSGYLMYVLAFEIQAVCLYCIGSALFSLSMLTLTVLGRSWEDVGQLFFIAIVVGMVTLIGTLGIYANVGMVTAEGRTPIPTASGAPQPPKGWEVTTTSGEAELALAAHLNEVDATMYGAYWCPHCYDQKQLLGQEAAKKINYIECAEDGVNPQPQACAEAGIRSYPTWEINGELVPGVQTLEELANLTGYEGPSDFQYTLPGR
jgi:uncharacterized membrane protein/glutaredoxin